MKYLLTAVFMAISCILTSEAHAEIWNCKFRILDRAEKENRREARIEVSGNAFNWLLPPPPGGREWTKFSYKVCGFGIE
jgi:hypothetical protein